jgi:hypothetical protein
LVELIIPSDMGAALHPLQVGVIWEANISFRDKQVGVVLPHGTSDLEAAIHTAPVKGGEVMMGRGGGGGSARAAPMSVTAPADAKSMRRNMSPPREQMK